MSKKGFGTIRKLQSGLFQAKYLHPFKKHKEDGRRNYISAPTTFARKTDAQIWLDKQRADIERGLWKSPEDEERERKEVEVRAKRDAFTWGELVEVSLRERKLSQEYARTVNSFIRVHLLPVWGEVPIKQIDVFMLSQWVNGKLAPDSPVSRKKSWEFFKSTFNDAVRFGFLDANPCLSVRVIDLEGTKVKARQDMEAKALGREYAKTHERHALTLSELVSVADFLGGENRLICLIGGFCGLRIGEIRALRGVSVEKRLTAGSGNLDVILRVCETYSGNGKNIYRKEPKTKSSIRDVHVPDFFRDELLELASVRGELPLFGSVKDSDVPFSDKTFNDGLARACKALGLPRASAHDLRHTYTSLAFSKGIPDYEVSESLGHADSVITKRYTHVFDERKRVNASIMSDMAKSASSVVSLGAVRARKHG